MASALWFLLSVSGLLTLLLVVSVWVLMRPASRIARAALLLLAAGYTIISIYPVPHAVANMIAYDFAPLTRVDVPPGPTVVVVLGSGSYSTYDWSGNQAAVLDSDGLARALEAARVYRLINPAWVVASGGSPGQGTKDRPPAEEVKRVLVDLGVPAARIVVRNTSANTHDEALMVSGILLSLKVEHVVLVTSALHLRRATGVFRAAGIKVIPAPAHVGGMSPLPWQLRFLPSQLGLGEASDVAHELGGLLVYRLRGWT